MDTGTIVNSEAEGRKAVIVTTDAAEDILNSFGFTITPAGIIHDVGTDPSQHLNIQADAEGEAVMDVTGTSAFVGLSGAITVTVTADGGGGNPGGLHITLGPALAKI
jgi:hypothetical protein